MILYFTDVADVMSVTDFYIHEPLADKEDCSLLMGYSCGERFEFWLNEDAFEYLREGLLSGKSSYLLNPTEKIHGGDENTPVYEIIKDD